MSTSHPPRALHRPAVPMHARLALLAQLALLIGGLAAPAAAQRPTAARSAWRDSAAAPALAPGNRARDDAPAADGDGTGFREGHLYVGPRVWAGVYGTLAVGVQGEKAIGGQRKDLGNGRIGVGGAVDMYSYSDAVLGYRWSYRVIPVSGFVNYHFTLKDSRIDPYAGIGLGYYIVSSSFDGPGGSDGSARGSAAYLGLQLGARYFVKPNLAVQAQTGLGLGALSLGVTWKR